MSQTVKTHKLAVTAILSAAAAILMFLSFPHALPDPVLCEDGLLRAARPPGGLQPGTRQRRGGVPGEERHQRVLFHHRRRGRAVQLPAGGLPGGARGAHLQGQAHRGGALAGALLGSAAMAVCSVPINYFISYPFYTSFMPLDTIIGMYQDLIPSVDGLLACW